MFKPLLYLSAAILFGSAPSIPNLPPTPAGAPQQNSVAAQSAAPAPSMANVSNPVKPTAESLAKAKRTYGFDCAMCHGVNGDGKTDLAKDMQLTLSDWSDPKALAGKTDGELFDIIRNGKGKMVAETSDRANDEMVWSLVQYIRGLGKGGAATASAAQN